MEAVLNFGVPQICVTSFNSSNGDDSIAPPIIMMFDNADQCAFLRDQVIIGSTNMVHLNIDQSTNGKILAAVYLESYRQDGFIFTPQEMEFFRQISVSDTPPYHDYKTRLTRVIFGGGFQIDRVVVDKIQENLKMFGHLELTIGFSNGGNADIHSNDELPFLEFDEYTTVPNSEFVDSVL